MGRAKQVKKSGICQPLPATISADECDAAFPQLAPTLSIGGPDGFESSFVSESDLPDCLEVRLEMSHFGDKAGDLTQSVNLSRFGLKRVAGGQGAVFERRPFGLRLRADQLGDVGYTTSRQCARAFPQA